MIVWIVETNQSWGDNHIVGVYDNKEAALKHCESDNGNYAMEDYKVRSRCIIETED